MNTNKKSSQHNYFKVIQLKKKHVKTRQRIKKIKRFLDTLSSQTEFRQFVCLTEKKMSTQSSIFSSLHSIRVF